MIVGRDERNTGSNWHGVVLCERSWPGSGERGWPFPLTNRVMCSVYSEDKYNGISNSLGVPDNNLKAALACWCVETKDEVEIKDVQTGYGKTTTQRMPFRGLRVANSGSSERTMKKKYDWTMKKKYDWTLVLYLPGNKVFEQMKNIMCPWFIKGWGRFFYQSSFWYLYHHSLAIRKGQHKNERAKCGQTWVPLRLWGRPKGNNLASCNGSRTRRCPRLLEKIEIRRRCCRCWLGLRCLVCVFSQMGCWINVCRGMKLNCQLTLAALEETLVGKCPNVVGLPSAARLGNLWLLNRSVSDFLLNPHFTQQIQPFSIDMLNIHLVWLYLLCEGTYLN